MTDESGHPQRRHSDRAQAQLDTRALELASENKARIEGHLDVCAIQYKNLDDKVGALKSDQDNNHRDNQAWMRRLEEKLDKLSTGSAVNDGKRDGAQRLGMTIKDWLIVGISAAALFYSIAHH